MPIVIGLGSGRSGTASLAEMLNSQPGSVCFHEANPACMAWEGALPTVQSMIADLATALAGGLRAVSVDRRLPHRTDPLQRYLTLDPLTVVGDVGSSYLPYVERILQQAPDTRFPVFRRPRAEVVDSFVRKLRIPPRRRHSGGPASRNHWVADHGTEFRPDPMWDQHFPTIEGAEDLPFAVGRYWDLYYATAQDLAARFPGNVRIIELEQINSAEGQLEVLRFCGVADPRPGTFHSNVGRPRRA